MNIYITQDPGLERHYPGKQVRNYFYQDLLVLQSKSDPSPCLLFTNIINRNEIAQELGLECWWRGSNPIVTRTHTHSVAVAKNKI